MSKQSDFFSNERGAILIYIFIAVALFAALGFAASRGMRGNGGEDINREVMRLHASAILDYARGIESAVKKLKIEGVQESQISFENAFVTDYENAACADTSCRIFSPASGGMTYIAPDPDWLDTTQATRDHYGTWLFTGHTCISGLGSGGNDCDSDATGTSEELIVFLPYIKRPLCVELNNRLGFGSKDADPAEQGGSAWDGTVTTAKFTGTFADSAELGSGNADFARIRTACFEGSASNPSGGFHFYYVLQAR